MFPYVSGSEGSKELPGNLGMLLTDFLNQLTRELHAFHAPCWGQNVNLQMSIPIKIGSVWFGL